MGNHRFRLKTLHDSSYQLSERDREGETEFSSIMEAVEHLKTQPGTKGERMCVIDERDHIYMTIYL
jgi:hypothetical protein